MNTSTAPTVLIVDDEPSITAALQFIIQEEFQWHTLVYHDPLEALSFLTQNKRLFGLRKHKIDAIIVDIKMPNMNGFEFIEAWRHSEGFHKIPIILLSAYEDEEKWKLASDLNTYAISAYLKKPLKKESLKEVLHRALITKDSTDMMAELRHYSYDKIHSLKNDMEYQAAKAIQLNLLPSPSFKMSGLDIQTFFKSAAYVGGDFYDFIPLSETQLAVFIVDIVGKGVPACMLMVRFRDLIRHHLKAPVSPADFMAHLNHLLCQDSSFNRYAPTFFGLLDLEDETFTYVNAIGNAGCVHVSGNTSKFLDTGGFMLGADPDECYQEGVLSIKQGDSLFFCTDGILEQSNRQSEQYGLDRLLATLTQVPIGSTPIGHVLSDLDQFMGNAKPDDDTTLISIQIL